jgi:retinol dehydrogenase 12
MKIAMITGPSSGIGKATALEMAKRGYHIVAAGRSEERTTQVVNTVNNNGGSAEYLHLDLASLSSCEKAARSFNDSGRTLDLLINNAGVGAVRGLTEDGFEIHFGVNHLGHFMLTHHLQPSLRPGSRVVMVSSEAHRRARGIDFARIRRSVGLLGVLNAYAVSKLANVLFANHLAHLQPHWRTYSVHPGVVDTNIFPTIVKPLLRNTETPEQAAQTSVWCATSDEIANQTGLYYSRMRQRHPSPPANDHDLGAELWRKSEKWCGVIHENN